MARAFHELEPPCGDCLAEPDCEARRLFESSSSMNEYDAKAPVGFLFVTPTGAACAQYVQDPRYQRIKAVPLISTRSRSRRKISESGANRVRDAATPWRSQGHAAARRRMAQNAAAASGLPYTGIRPSQDAIEIPDIVTGNYEVSSFIHSARTRSVIR